MGVEWELELTLGLRPKEWELIERLNDGRGWRIGRNEPCGPRSASGISFAVFVGRFSGPFSNHKKFGDGLSLFRCVGF
jgi:hypothetical protein